MTVRILLEPGGDALLVEPGSYLLWELLFAPLPPPDRKLHVFPRNRTFTVAARQGIWVPPRRAPGVTN